MPFPPGIKRASEIVTALNLMELAGQTLALISFTMREARTFGGPVCRLVVVDEDGVEQEVYTTSRVVAEQLALLEEKLPILITPKYQKGYLTIF